MAAASLIATALGIVLILLTAYFLTGGALSAIVVVSDAQKDMTALQVKMLGTSIEILEYTNTTTTTIIKVMNNGREPIHDYKNMDIFILHQNGWERFTGDNNNITPRAWNPGKVIEIYIPYGDIPESVKIVTSNSITAIL